MGTKSKNSILTLVISIVNSIVLVVFNLVYTNLLIRTYGSEINGLISTLTQFVNLFLVIEGGFTTAAVVAVYEPIINNNIKKINDILYTTKKVYMIIGGVISGAVLLIGGVYIYFIDSPFDYWRTYAFLGICVMTMVSSLCFQSKYCVFLQGMNKEYIQTSFNLLSRIFIWIISIIMISSNQSIWLVYSLNIINVVVNIWMLKFYEKKRYPYITYKGEYHKEYIQGTKHVLFQKIASTIFTSTDLVIISSCIDLFFASVYNLYFQIFKAVFGLLASICQAPFNSFGQLIKEKRNILEIYNYFQIFQYMVNFVSTVLFTVVGVLIIPFINLYTKEIKDHEYKYPLLAILLFAQFYVQIVNRPYGSILNAAGLFKMQNVQCGLSAIVNIVLSLLFVKKIGIYSVVFGSFIATIIILIMNIYQVHKKLFKIPVGKSIVIMTVNFFVGIIFIIYSSDKSITIETYGELMVLGIEVGVLTFFIILICNFILNQKCTIETFQYVKKLIVK